MREFDFDTPVSRRGSGSYKWDDTPDFDVIPLWVADMDFRTASVVIDALRKRVEHGVFGYTLVDDSYYDAMIQWFDTHHNYCFDKKQVIYTSGVVPALSAIIKALAPQGSKVAVQTPVYNCFFSSIRNNGCTIADAPLKRIDTGTTTFTYRMDYETLENICSDKEVKLMLLCNPHNPAGRCWTRAELEKLAEITRRHGVRVVSDEIHCELTMPGYEYVPYGTVDPDAIVCLSPSKAFNTAGLQIANIVCPDSEVRKAVDRAININEVCDVNPFEPAALKASYSRDGKEWLDSLIQYLWQNKLYLEETVNRRLPTCKIAALEATYLLWIDVSSLQPDTSLLEQELMQQAKVWINSGEMYGQKGYIRVNIACPRSTLAEGLDRLCNYLEKL